MINIIIKINMTIPEIEPELRLLIEKDQNENPETPIKTCEIISTMVYGTIGLLAFSFLLIVTVAFTMDFPALEIIDLIIDHYTNNSRSK